VPLERLDSPFNEGEWRKFLSERREAIASGIMLHQLSTKPLL
jgi:hypothetical protein